MTQSKMGWLERWRQRVQQLKLETYTLYLAYRDPRVPWGAKLFTMLVVAYAFSPIDLIPDFIPVLGYLDDLILLPLGIALALRMIPADVVEEKRAEARLLIENHPQNWAGGVLIIAIWLMVIVWVGMLIYRTWVR